MRKSATREKIQSLAVRLKRDTSGIVVAKLAGIIEDVACNVSRKLGKGLPRSLYQLALLHHLEQSGLNLEVVPSMLNSKESSSVDREIILVDDRLIIECICEQGLSMEMEEVYRCRLSLDVKAKGYDMGLVVNFDRYLTESISKVH